VYQQSINPVPADHTNPDTCKHDLVLPERSTEHIRDTFAASVPPGDVIGSTGPGGRQRGGVDAEGVLTVHDHALRIKPLAVPGWQRVGIAYGPFTRRNGLAMAAAVLNADQGSAPYQLPSLSRRIGRWLLGSGETPIWLRLLRFPLRYRREPMARRLACWKKAMSNQVTEEQLGGNLAVGWFPSEVPTRPPDAGQVWLIRCAGPENGHLAVRAGNGLLTVHRRLANVPLHMVVILREQGAAYYLASLEGAAASAPYPFMRPLGIDATGSEAELWPGLHQSAMGEIGFSTDTVVAGIAVSDLPTLSSWFGTAMVADRLTGTGDLTDSAAEIGGWWRGATGALRRCPDGAQFTGPGAVTLDPGHPTGLIHLVAEQRSGSLTVLWRRVDADNCWLLHLDSEGSRLEIKSGGVVRTTRMTAGAGLRRDGGTPVQIADDGATVQIAIYSIPVPELTLEDGSHADATVVGLSGSGPSVVRLIECHPRAVPIPEELRLGAPWSESGMEIVVEERFDGPARNDLDGYGSVGGPIWRKLVGIDAMSLDGKGGAQVVASPTSPLRQRLAYGVDWPDPYFADVTTTVLPPEVDEAGNCRGRGGLIFWQDPLNFITINTWLDNRHTGGFKHCGAVSSFFTLNGFEDIYDAAWTNVADAIKVGEPCSLRIVFDGDRYRAYVNGEAVLYRALSDIYPNFRGLMIRRVGILANWEWGYDTGSRFLTFTALAREQRPLGNPPQG
jgi:hypothetical protein